MKEIVLFDSSAWYTLLPLTYLRSVCDNRVGMLTIREKWAHYAAVPIYVHTIPYLQDLYAHADTPKERIWIDSSVLPSKKLVKALATLKSFEALVDGDELIAIKTADQVVGIERAVLWQKHWKLTPIRVDRIRHPEDILEYCDQEFGKDYHLLTSTDKSVLREDQGVRYRGDRIYVHPDAKVYDCVLNATEGPIFIGAHAEVMEQAVIRGPVGIGTHSTIHVGAKVYAHTMLGPHCKIGGEIKRTTIYGYTNKAHDGYLGDSVIAQWCNLGADTNNSNMKNTYGHVSLWNPANSNWRTTGRQFLGLIMGDHSMSAINTAFMTGSVTGVFANIFGSVYPSRWSPSFSWGDSNQPYDVDKAIDVARKAMLRRGILLSEPYQRALMHIAAL